MAEGDRDPARIRERVVAPPTPAEWLVIGSVVAIVVLASRYDNFGIDWEIFAGAADGRMVSERELGYYYPYWLLPLFDLFDHGGRLGAIAWSLANVAGVWFAARVFGARPPVVLAGFGAVSAFFTGTITGLALAALAGIHWAVHERRWTIVGALSLVALAKPQWGAPIALVLVLAGRPDLRAWARMTIVPVPVVAASFAAFGWWPGEILDRAAELPPEGNGSLWHFLGPVVLVLWLPVLLPMSTQRRTALVAATSLLAVPYVQQYDYTVAFVLFGDGLGLLQYAYGLLYDPLGWTATRGVLTALPLTAWVMLVREPITMAWRRRSSGSSRLPNATPDPA